MHKKIAAGIFFIVFGVIIGVSLSVTAKTLTEGPVMEASEFYQHSYPKRVKKHISPAKKAKWQQKTAPHATTKVKCWAIKADQATRGKSPAYICVDSKQQPTHAGVLKKRYVTVAQAKKPPQPKPQTYFVSEPPAPKLQRLPLVTRPAQEPPFVAAGIQHPDNKSQKDDALGHPYLGIIAGASLSKIGVQQKGGAVANVYNQWLPSNGRRGAGLFGLNSGYEFALDKTVLLAFGLGLYQTTDYRATGDVWSIDESTGTNTHMAKYEYKLYSTRLMAETQFAVELDFKNAKLIPFISLGIGSSLNSARSYEETLTDPTFTASGFKPNLKPSFAYQFGAGIACPFNSDHDRLFAAYRFADLGQAHFKKADNAPATANMQLDTGKIRAHEVFVGYTHLFGL